MLDADIRDFFGQLDRGWLEKFLGHRIADERVLRLIGKWLAAGVIEDGTWTASERAHRRAGYVQLNIMTLMSSAGLCAALACWRLVGAMPGGERCA